MREEDLSDNRLKTTTISHAFCALHHESFGFGLLDMILESELVIDMSLLTFYLVSYILTLNGDRKTCGEREGMTCSKGSLAGIDQIKLR